MVGHNLKKCQNCEFRANDATRMKNHMASHTTYKCNRCDKVTTNKNDLNNHITNEHKSEIHACNQCQRTFTAPNALKQHINSQHPANTPVGHPQWAEERNQSQVFDYNCNMCGFMCETLQQLKKHRESEHIGETFNGFKTVSHRSNKEWTDACTRGQQCRFLAWGSCHFFHPGVGVQKRRLSMNRQQQLPMEQQNRQQEQPNRQQQEQTRQHMLPKMCHFQNRCWNQKCQFTHKDFTMLTEFQENY